MRAVIADTSAIYALVDADVIHHARAVAFVRQEAPHIRLLVTDVTLFESITLIKSRLGHSAASRALHSVRSSGRFRVIELTDRLKPAASHAVLNSRG